jgi:hypothetical protein
MQRLPVCEVEGELLAHEDCTKYYLCSNGVPIASDCPGGLFFNPGLDPPNCDFDFNVTDCAGGTRDPEPGTGPTEPLPTETTTLAPTDGPSTGEPTFEPTTEPVTEPTTTAVPVDPTTEPEPATTEQPLPSSTVSSGVCPPDGIDYVPYPGKQNAILMPNVTFQAVHSKNSEIASGNCPTTNHNSILTYNTVALSITIIYNVV